MRAGSSTGRTSRSRPSWTGTLTANLIAEASYTRSRDDVFIDVYTETDLYKRSRTGINYPYIFPDNKEIPDKIPTINIGAPFSTIDGGPYPGVVARADSHVLRHLDLRQGPAHVQGWRRRRVLR